MPRPVHPEDLFALSFLTGSDLSPDASQVAFTATRVAADQEVADLWLVAVATGETRRLTYTDAVHAAPAFSPDGRQLAFLAARGGAAQLWVIDATGGEARQLTELPRGVASGPAWSPDGTRIAFSAGPQGEPRDPAAPYRVTRTVWRADGIGLVDDAVSDIYVVDLAGSEVTRLTNDSYVNGSPRWDPDGNSLVYLASHDPDGFAMSSRLRRVTLDQEVTDLPSPEGVVFAHAVAADGRIAFVVMFEAGRPIGSGSQLYVLEPGATEARLVPVTVPGALAGGLQMDMPALALALPTIVVDGDRALVPVQQGGAVALAGVDLGGQQPSTIVAGGERALSLQAARGGHLLVAAAGFTSPPDLFLLSPEGGEGRRLTTLNADLQAELSMPTVHPLRFPAVDGASVEAWFLAPEGVGPHPTVLFIHGGPHAGFGHTFNFDALMLSGAGFGVLMVNHRGSTGYGDDFATAIIGDWGNLDYADLMSAVDHAIDQGHVDGDRLGVMGVSGGGNLTGWVIGHTDRFKAACPENPLFDWQSFYGTSDVGAWMARAELGGDPHEEPELYRRCSPITFAHQVRTPTLFLQHESDYRCPAEQTEQFYRIVRLQGVPAEMMRFPGTSHGGSTIGPLGHRRAQNDAVLDWMNRYVLGKDT